MLFELTYKTFGAKAILIEWPERIGLDVLDDILDLKQKIENQLDDVLEIVVGYNSLTTIFYSNFDNGLVKIDQIKTVYKSQSERLLKKGLNWEIPVCYDACFGLDQVEMSERLGISISDIIKTHTASIYTVYFIGFLPGFLYLGGLDKSLHLARKSTPRLDVFKGAVAIGGSQTGIYPNPSAGGWHIIGKTPVSFFDVSKTAPCFAKSGDTITFKAISKTEFNQLEQEVEAGLFQLKPGGYD